MEVQSPQSVQINFNNKIITLHNVKLVKNPKIITIDASQYSSLLKGSPVKLSSNAATSTSSPIKIQMPSLAPMKAVQVSASNSIRFNQPVNSFMLQRSIITQVPKLASPQVIRTILSPQKNASFISPSISEENCKATTYQAIPKKQQPTVIISPPKSIVTNNSSQPNTPQVAPIPTKVIAKSPTSVVTIAKSEPLPAKVIISPQQKNKVSPVIIPQPEAKRQCQMLKFSCIFCKDIFEDSDVLVQHLKIKHPESIRIPDEYKDLEVPDKLSVSPPQPISDGRFTQNETLCKQELLQSEDEEDEDDESEVHDLIMDIEDTQDTATSGLTRSDTPESPEFEQHLPSVAEQRPMKLVEAIKTECDLDFDEYEYFSDIMEPICELSCEDDSNDNIQDENEAMRLYREAMEVNYQKNGIKKRGRRKARKPKPLVENTMSLNGILAGLLESAALKVPPGPGRGRRKEINEHELEMDRSNGICLFSCNKCDETFKYAGDLAKHVRSHTINSPYQCSICQRKFTHIGSLNTHLRIHSGEVSFPV